MAIRRYTYRGWHVDKLMPSDFATVEMVPHVASCPFCSSTLARKEATYYGSHDVFSYLDLCGLCGWWHLAYSENDSNDLPLDRCNVTGELETFNLDGLDLPTAQLVAHLARHTDDVYYIHPWKLEDVVGKIYEDHFDCAVEMTKRTRDGGKDLICMDSEKRKFIIEVKRYSPQRRVGIQMVDRFLGVLHREQLQRGIIVTTSGFTRDALAASRLLAGRKDQIELELHDADDLFSWLRLYALSGWAFPEQELKRKVSDWLFFPKVDDG